MNEEAQAILTAEIKALEDQLHGADVKTSQALRGQISSKQIRLKTGQSTSVPIHINPARLSPQDRKSESLRMREHWKGCKCIDG